MSNFSAVLLAGGRSARMGRDKALLTLPGSNLLLCQRQLRILQELNPQEILWSGSPRPSLPSHLRIIPDQIDNAGPLAGISACLNASKSDLLIVLAIDLPQMEVSFLQNLLARSSPTCGIVPQLKDFFEPLAAIYPKALATLAANQLSEGQYALQEFIRKAIREGALQPHQLSADELPLFKNVNSPADLEAPAN